VKIFPAVLVFSWLALAAPAALPQPDLLLQLYFAGAQKISADPHASAFTNEFCSREALALRAQTATRLSAWLSGWLQTNLTATVPDGTAKLRPLFDDLQTSEFFLEVREAANNQPEAAIAIKLAPARAQLWQGSLKPFFDKATFKSAGSWLIFDSNPALLGLGDRLAQKTATPPASWLFLDVNWPLLAQWHPLLKELALPETQFSVTAPADYFNINGKFFFPENLSLKLEPWRIPTNTLHQPFNSLTAVRGFSSWWQSQPWAQSCQITPVPNQFISWSLPMLPMQTFVAVPVRDASGALSQAYGRLVPIFTAANLVGELMPAITPEMANNEIDFPQLPWVALKLRALTEPGGQFLMLELGPNMLKSKPLPLELYRRLQTQGLVFYHYEATGSRIRQLLHLTQLGLMVTRHQQLSAGMASFNWVEAIGTNLTLNPIRDQTDTEISQTGPAEFTFARKTPVGFTALEFYAMASWLEAPNFPGFNISLPPPRKRLAQPSRQPIQITPVPPKH
jgi:hypothetical protein